MIFEDFLLDYIPYVESRLHQYDVDGLKRGRHPGYDGSRIVNELGFEYKYTDPKQTLVDATESMIKHNIVDGKSHPMPIITNLAMLAAGLLIIFVAWM